MRMSWRVASAASAERHREALGIAGANSATASQVLERAGRAGVPPRASVTIACMADEVATEVLFEGVVRTREGVGDPVSRGFVPPVERTA